MNSSSTQNGKTRLPWYTMFMEKEYTPLVLPEMTTFMKNRSTDWILFGEAASIKNGISNSLSTIF